jgi:hypothetical protein
MWDMAWVKSRGPWLNSATAPLLDSVLVLECEWTTKSGVMDDFRKLLMARGDHRVMIFQAAGPEARQKLLDQMIGEVANFAKRQGGDRQGHRI